MAGNVNTFEFKGAQYKVSIQNDYGRRGDKEIAYVHAEFPVDAKTAIKPYAIAAGVPDAHIYTAIGDYPLVDSAWKNYNKLIVEFQKEILDAAGAALNIDVSNFKFSVNAGCSCGCSPGWARKNKRQNIFIEKV